MRIGKQKKNSPAFDQKLADTYVGKYILVGITYYDHLGNEKDHDQLHGVIQSATLNGIKIALRGVREGNSWNMPPVLEVIKPGGPGRYTLSRTKEVVENPDLLATWAIKEVPPKH